MLILEEGARHLLAVARDVAQMDEMDAWRQRLDHRGQIVVRPRAERAGAEGDAVGRHVDRIEHVPIVGQRRHDARQPEQWKRRIVGMAAQPYTEPFGMRRDLAEEIGQVLAQLLRSDPVIGRQMRRQRVEFDQCSCVPGSPA